jgi:hypothetical protein
MSIRCKNGTEHTHETVAQSRLCWSRRHTPTSTGPVVASPPPPAPRIMAPPPPPVVHAVPDTITQPQLDEIERLGGDVVHAYKLTKSEASNYITRLQNRPVDTTPRRTFVSNDSRFDLIKGMIDMVSDGYYATAHEGEGRHVDFIRISRPQRGKYRGSIKIQTQHSDVWKEAIVGWPSGKWSVYRNPAIDILMQVIADPKSCSLRYAIEVQSCCICNKALTDDRSRHYLVGPVCDKKPYGERLVQKVDELNGGLTFEQLWNAGLPTRTWQDTAVA